MKYYLAYGSNLSVEQMLRRCPGAIYVGYGFLKDWRLLFRRSYLTVEKKKGRIVPVLVWQVNDADETALDRYEGWPRFYRKENLPMGVYSFIDDRPIGTVDAFIYIMDESYPLYPPVRMYWDVCAEGYARFGFDLRILEKALKESSPSQEKYSGLPGKRM